MRIAHMNAGPPLATSTSPGRSQGSIFVPHSVTNAQRWTAGLPNSVDVCHEETERGIGNTKGSQNNCKGITK